MMMERNFGFNTVADDAEELDELTILMLMAVSGQRIVVPKACIKLFSEEVLPIYSVDDFKSHFRLSRETTEV